MHAKAVSILRRKWISKLDMLKAALMRTYCHISYEKTYGTDERHHSAGTLWNEVIVAGGNVTR